MQSVFAHVCAMTLGNYKSAVTAVTVLFVLQTSMSPYLAQCCQLTNIVKNQHKTEEDRQTDTYRHTDKWTDRQTDMSTYLTTMDYSESF